MSRRPRHACSLFLFVATSIPLLLSGPISGARAADDPDAVAAGERLVAILDCNVCHTPKVLGDRGPQPDPAHLLSGHPAGEKLAPVPAGLIGPEGWGGVFNHGLTAWTGPWGTTFGTNLTPDPETGIGEWTEEDFAEAMRGGARPPMPAYERLTDEEIHAIFSYLRSIPAVANAVPGALPPPGGEGSR